MDLIDFKEFKAQTEAARILAYSRHAESEANQALREELAALSGRGRAPFDAADTSHVPHLFERQGDAPVPREQKKVG